VGQNSLSWGDAWYTDYLIHTCQPGGKEGTSNIGCGWPPWHIDNRQIHEDLGISFLTDYIGALTESFDLKLAGVGNP
jgi:hypothetical protein